MGLRRVYASTGEPHRRGLRFPRHETAKERALRLQRVRGQELVRRVAHEHGRRPVRAREYQNLDARRTSSWANAGANRQQLGLHVPLPDGLRRQDLKQDKWKVQLGRRRRSSSSTSALSSIWKENDYQAKNDTLGRWKDKRDEVYVNLSYGDPAAMRFTIFGDWERVKYEGQHRVCGTSTATTLRPYARNMPPTATTTTGRHQQGRQTTPMAWPSTGRRRRS